MTITRAQHCREAASCLRCAAEHLAAITPPPAFGPEVLNLVRSLAEWAEVEGTEGP